MNIKLDKAINDGIRAMAEEDRLEAEAWRNSFREHIMTMSKWHRYIAEGSSKDFRDSHLHAAKWLDAILSDVEKIPNSIALRCEKMNSRHEGHFEAKLTEILRYEGVSKYGTPLAIANKLMEEFR